MLALTQQTLTPLLNEFVARIQANIRGKRVTPFGPMNASGQTAESVHFEFGDNSATIYAAGHILRLESGNPPGTKVPFKRLRMWIDQKPIAVQLTARMDGSPRRHRDGSAITLEDQKDSVAWAIKKAIEQKGTTLFQQGGNSGILKDVINEEAMQVLYRALFFEFESIVTSALLK
jgi:hypothetical protein